MVESGRNKWERRTLEAMVAMYCRGRHGSRAFCEECLGLLDYARGRLRSCPHAEDKPTCANCRTHCYKPLYRERVREVMRYAGPRMPLRHPLLAVRHLWRGYTDRKKGRSAPR